MNVLELFAGIGGLSLGLERAGFDVVGQVEINEWARSVLARHWPEVPKHDDVRTALDWWRSEPRPHVDLVAGGYPCQPESLNGRRGGTGDERWLWPEFARIVSALRPRYVLGENVIGHRTSGLRFVLRDLELLGYTARAGVVGAYEVGALHQRKRIIVLAERNDVVHPESIHDARGRLAQTSHSGTFKTKQAKVADAERFGQRGAGVAIAAPGDRAAGDPAESGRCGSGGPAAWREWWALEPGVGRVAHGVPGRVDRLRGLGNAVVPQVAEAMGRLLLSGRWREGI